MGSDPAKTRKEKEEEETEKQKPNEPKKQKRSKEVEKRSIVQMSSTSLKPNQKNWSIVEIELLAIVWSLEHSGYYTLANPDVHIITDHNPIVGILGKSLHQIDNTRIVKLIEQISHYSLTIEHVKGSENHIADMLSRNPDGSMEAPEVERNFDNTRRIKRVMMRSEARGKKENFPRDLQIIAEKGRGCSECQKMLQTIQKKEKVHEIGKNNPLKEFRNMHGELNVIETEAGSLLYAGDRLIPPKSARKDLLEFAHTTHLGEEVIWRNVKKD